MAGPANPFLGLGQRDGSAGPAGRGRGGGPTGRSTPYQPKANSATRDPRLRGRGRGASAVRGTRGHGRGASAGNNVWRKQAEPQAESAAIASSPFGQSKQSAPSSATPPVQSSPSPSPFAGFGKASPGSFGTPSSFAGAQNGGGNTVSQRQPFAQQPNGAMGANVPVEDASLLSSYTDRYEKLKLDRTKQREKAIREGQMADPNQPTSLQQAITPVGTCTSMCPEFERVERIVQKMVDKSEKYLHPATNTLQNMELKMLKRFRRSAAGYDAQLPSDIRTPHTLLQTMNYLIRHVLNGSEPLGLIHKFVWDRTRSIRNDFSVQQLTQEDDVKIAVTCLERIARFHIVSLHLLSSPANEEPFDRHQEREQLNNTMLSLMYYYDDNRGRIPFPNEDEFRAYYILFSIHDQRPDLESRVQKWPVELRSSPRVQMALELFAAASNTWEYQGTLDAKRPNAIAQGFYMRFFNLIDSPGVPYLMACVAEIYFNHMRQTAIRSIWKAYCRYPASQQHKNEEWTVDELTTVLRFDNYDQTIKFCEEQDLQFAENANGDLYLNWGSRPVDSVAFQPSSDHAFSETYVESKRAGRTLPAIILGLNIKEAANLEMIDSSLLPERVPALPAPQSHTSGNDDSLFVSDDDNPPAFRFTPSHGSSRNSPTSTSSLQNTFANVPPAASSTESTPGATFSFAQPSITSQAPEKQVAPSSLFPNTSSAAFGAPSPSPSAPFASVSPPFPQSGQTQLGLPATSSSQSSSFPSPFASGASPFSQFKPPQQEHDLAAFPSNQQASASSVTTTTSPFSFSNPPPEDGIRNPTPNTSSAQQVSASSPFSSTTSTFNFGQPAQQEQTKPTFPTLNNQPSASIFAGAQSPIPEKQQETASPLPSPTPFKFPGSVTPQPFSTSPFSTSVPASASNPISSTPGNSAPSIFNTNTRPSSDVSSGLSFSASVPSPASDNAAAQQPPSLFSNSSEEPPKPLSPAPLFSAPLENIYQPAVFFAKPPAVQSDDPSQGKQGQPGDVKPSYSGEETGTPTQTKLPAVSVSDKEPELQLNELVPQPEPQPAAIASSNSSSPATEETPARPLPETVTFDNDAPVQRASWLSALKEAAVRRREIKPTTGRKRVLEEPEEPSPTQGESGTKAFKALKPEALHVPNRKSMALSSVKPLPKLPILEQIESMTARKPTAPPKPQEPRSIQVDEDELLLSAARIAAESLRSGPRILDGWPAASYDGRASSFSTRSSASPSYAFSRSQSPQSGHVNGHEVSLAPDTDLGLGRTMSRTEQRIRMTGAKGLAYKPLDFGPADRKRKSR
ncbi:putative leucine permease transcriptional regulator (SAC3) [Aspergillus homomorphus CBS 101889]|uniref:SAC3/GANP/THP3 conserved domain-containing protein n=1 Tax=Aspergillus homomorphus (strain CBS 101889) TaxID=1450537 RepID=A0A395I3B0_ASPHC|nr:hypothetical protein BO97DRAFT_279905 [Aspergillus homomorphus CBS 101889]RAL14206.1 hypothetical protein BO97DRAFT_279905 [Aspergillus homomorphus CBS 101889]